jgi:hypothetical protein
MVTDFSWPIHELWFRGSTLFSLWLRTGGNHGWQGCSNRARNGGNAWFYHQIWPLYQPFYLGCWEQSRCINFTCEGVCTGRELWLQVHRLCKHMGMAWNKSKQFHHRQFCNVFTTYVHNIYLYTYICLVILQYIHPVLWDTSPVLGVQSPFLFKAWLFVGELTQIPEVSAGSLKPIGQRKIALLIDLIGLWLNDSLNDHFFQYIVSSIRVMIVIVQVILELL